MKRTTVPLVVGLLCSLLRHAAADPPRNYSCADLPREQLIEAYCRDLGKSEPKPEQCADASGARPSQDAVDAARQRCQTVAGFADEIMAAATFDELGKVVPRVEQAEPKIDDNSFFSWLSPLHHASNLNNLGSPDYAQVNAKIENYKEAERLARQGVKLGSQLAMASPEQRAAIEKQLKAVGEGIGEAAGRINKRSAGFKGAGSDSELVSAFKKYIGENAGGGGLDPSAPSAEGALGSRKALTSEELARLNESARKAAGPRIFGATPPSPGENPPGAPASDGNRLLWPLGIAMGAGLIGEGFRRGFRRETQPPAEESAAADGSAAEPAKAASSAEPPKPISDLVQKLQQDYAPYSNLPGSSFAQWLGSSGKSPVQYADQAALNAIREQIRQGIRDENGNLIQRSP